MSNYATKTDLKNVTEIDTSKLAVKSYLVSLKAEVDKLDIGKVEPFPVDLSKLSDAVKNDVAKKTAYDKLVASNIDNSGFNLKTKYDTNKLELEKQIPNTSGLVKKLDFNAKITDIENKIPSISGLAANVVLTTAGNKMPIVSRLVKETDYNTKISEIEKKVTDHDYDK